MKKDKKSKAFYQMPIFWIVVGAVVAAVIAVVAVILLCQPFVKVIGEKDVTATDESGVKKISAAVSYDCNISESSDGYLYCADNEVSGEYSKDLELKTENEGVDISNGNFKFTPKIKIKDVAIRNEAVNDSLDANYTFNLYKDGEVIIEYNLTVKAMLNEQDLSLVNRAPDANRFKKALEKIETISDVCIVNEDNDPNGEIGKEGSYYIKLVFRDSRAPVVSEIFDEKAMTMRPPANACEIGADAGGTIETYKYEDGAQQRKDYLDAFNGGLLASGPSEIIGGTSVIRASSELKASEQKDLLNAMKKALTE